MAIAHEAASEGRKSLGWLEDNPLVRAVGRVPLPLGGKLLVGFTVVAALLALIAALGLRALSQSNSRGEELRSLEQTASFVRIVEADANQLSTLVDQRSGGVGGFPALPRVESMAMDADVLAVWERFQADVQLPAVAGGLSRYARSVDPRFVP